MTIADDDPRQPFEQTADDLRERIKSGDISPGQRLGSVRTLARRYGISPTTAQKALGILRNEGWITTSGRGNFARDPKSLRAGSGSVSGKELADQLAALRSEVADLVERVQILEEAKSDRAGQ